LSDSDHWDDLIAIDELEKSDVTPVSYRNRLIAIYDTEDGLYASDARCSHAGANLCDGYFDGKNIECPLHQGLFDARTGKALAAPATRPLKMFDLRIKDDRVQINSKLPTTGQD